MEPRLSVVIPCYNERDTILEVVRRVRDAYPNEKEIILVDDGSNDGTREVLKAQIEPIVSKLIYHDRNRGKGAALRSAFAAATGNIILVQDADLEYNPADYPKLLNPIISEQADVVFGSRFVGADPRRVLFFWHSVGNKLLTLLSNAFTDLNLTDMETGFKVFRKEVISQIHIEEERFGIEPEITAKTARLGCRIYEVGISYQGRTYAEGKKINWRDGLRAMWCIFKYNLISSRTRG
jgi:glycosyltransferase involved in cell wall biosynthesis